MTDFNTRGKLPFAVVSSSVTTGYVKELSSSVGYNIELVNHHKDDYGELQGTPLQSPFTQQHVGGNQHRHVKLNEGTDNSDNRPEGYIISGSTNSVKIYGPDINGINKPRSILTRDITAKSPVNIKNIETSGNIAGNFEHNYQVVQSVGRRTSNNLINDNFIASGSLITQFVSGTPEYSLPDITNNSKSIFVERFNAPGGKEVSSRGALDREGEEYAPNNSLTTRNIKVRQPYYNQLTQHNIKINETNLSNSIIENSSITEFVFTKKSFRVASQEPFADGLFISPDGTKMFVVGEFNDQVRRYDLSIPFDVTSATYISGFAVWPGQTPKPQSVFFSPDGLNMYVVGENNHTCFQYSLTTPWDLSSGVSYTGNNLNVLSQTPSPHGIFFSNDGTNFYCVGSNKLAHFILSTPWNITSATIQSSITFSSPTYGLLKGVHVSPDGKYAFIISESPKRLIKLNLVKSWFLEASEIVGTIELTSKDISVRGDKLFIVSSAVVYQYDIRSGVNRSDKIPKNSIQRIEEQNGAFVTASNYDNFWVQHAIPSTDLRYKWIADSVSSSQQPLQYQSYGEEYSRGAQFTDLQFEGKGPFGDHYGISGAIDKEELFVSTNTNTMYRDKKYFRFTTSSLNFAIDMSNVSSKISNKNFSISLWVNIPKDPTDIGPFPIIWYGGSSGENRFRFDYEFGSTYRFKPFLQSTIKTVDIKKALNTDYDDNKWHLLTLVNNIESSTISSVSSQGINSATTLVNTKVYFDDGLIFEGEQEEAQIIIEYFKIYSRLATLQDLLVSDILIWDSSLSQEEVSYLFRNSKTEYGNFHKKYLEYNLDNEFIKNPIHVYSTKIDEINGILYDEVGNISANLLYFTSSLNLRPKNTGLISYSTYFNGPYQGASWKTIRNAEHPVTRKLTTENTNITSILIPDSESSIEINGEIFPRNKPKKQGTLLNFKESPVYLNNKPLKHTLTLKSSINQNRAFELTHTYTNNLQYFANSDVNLILNLDKSDPSKSSFERQMYNTLLEYYDGTVDSNESPINRLDGYAYSETIFPKTGKSLLKDTRQRTDYIIDQPGYGPDGYDRQLGTQRAFWRDKQEDRMRSSKYLITSLGETIQSPFEPIMNSPSVAAFEFIKESSYLEITDSSSYSLLDVGYKNAAELNNSNFWYYIQAFGFGNVFKILVPIQNVAENYFFADYLVTSRDDYNVVLNKGTTPYFTADKNDPSSVRARPRYIYEHTSLQPFINEAVENLFFTYDLGLNRTTEIDSGKKPWYDSYEDFYEDIKLLSNSNLKTYSKLPEFKISDNIRDLIGDYSGDFTKIKLNDYLDDINFTFKDSIEEHNSEFTVQDKITFKIDVIKKLLPYNGFYPQDRSIQLVNYFKESYLDTNAIDGGFLVKTNAGQIYIQRDLDLEADKLSKYLKQSAFLEPFYAPGIFYNMIKSGIAVDWSLYTGSLPTASADPADANLGVTAVGERPSFKINFESLLNLKNIPLSSSLQNEENRYMKHKDIAFGNSASDYFSGINGSFQGFFERIEKGSNLYSLSINNFLAETINFFLKDSKLNSFISKPDSDFNFDSNKTYYMDVVLKKKDITMCEAYSASNSANQNFGKMKGRYFGPSIWSGSLSEKNLIEDDFQVFLTQRDPSYCIYTPPYFYGDAIARLSFKPLTTRKYTLDEILDNLNIENINTAFLDNSVFPSGTLYSTFSMPVESSVTLNGIVAVRTQTVDRASLQAVQNNLSNFPSNLVGTVTNFSGIKKWIISPKMETPVLDFTAQRFLSSSIIPLTEFEKYYGVTEPLTISGFGKGMWSGYGQIPTEDSGIFLELRESYPKELVGKLDPITRKFTETNTGSLLQVCGFEQANTELSKKIGEIADSREISEAIIIIPYSEDTRYSEEITYGFNRKLQVNGTVKIEDYNFFRINEEVYNKQLENISSGKSAVLTGEFEVTRGEIPQTSITEMIKKMQKYVIPPNFDFINNRNIKPFVMYIAEFTSNLDKQDLADVWQGLMPKIATTAEKEEQIISHSNTLYDFFHGRGLPKNIKFMIFKVKKRAEVNYYKMTGDSRDDGLFSEIQVGRSEAPYSFNWPYDYCSLIETAKVDVEIEYVSGSNDT